MSTHENIFFSISNKFKYLTLAICFVIRRQPFKGFKLNTKRGGRRGKRWRVRGGRERKERKRREDEGY